MKELLTAENFVWGNMVWNAGWFLVALGFIFRWIKGIEKKVGDYCNNNREDHKDIHNRITSHETRISKVEAWVEK